MLRESAKVDAVSVDLAGVTDIMVDSKVPLASSIIALTDSVVLGDADELPIARTALSELLGVAGTVRIIAVASNFMMMNIIMDVLGTPPNKNLAALAMDLGLDQTVG